VRDHHEHLDNADWHEGLKPDTIDDIRQSIAHPGELGYFQLTPLRKPTLRRKFELFDQIRDARAVAHLTRVAVDDYFDCVLSVHARDYAPTNHCVIKCAGRV